MLERAGSTQPFSQLRLISLYSNHRSPVPACRGSAFQILAREIKKAHHNCLRLSIRLRVPVAPRLADVHSAELCQRTLIKVFHSSRSVFIGSTLVARYDGTAVASKATPASSIETLTIVAGSVVFTPNTRLAMTRPI